MKGRPVANSFLSPSTVWCKNLGGLGVTEIANPEQNIFYLSKKCFLQVLFHKIQASNQWKHFLSPSIFVMFFGISSFLLRKMIYDEYIYKP